MHKNDSHSNKLATSTELTVTQRQGAHSPKPNTTVSSMLHHPCRAAINFLLLLLSTHVTAW